MSRLWEWVDKKNLSEQAKTGVFLFLNMVLYGVLGFLVWMVISRFTLSTLDWAVCFVGYPGFFIGYLGGFFFLCRK
ncbi:MAG: hypothetical protein ACI4AQ_01715 [Lachnospiraceae bacterium]